jgi:hypothetical protein
MRRLSWSILLALLASVPLAAHFVFVVPAWEPGQALVVLSETPAPDPEVDVAMITNTTLSFRSLEGRDTPVTLKKGANAFNVSLPSPAPGIVHGRTDLGVTSREGSIPHVLLYYPKTIIGNPFEPRTRLGSAVPIEIVPVGTPESYRLLLLVNGAPVTQGEIAVIGPNGKEATLSTDAEGLTGAFTGAGRYAAWARYWQRAPGERGGRQYQELRHYATLVFDVAAAPGATAARAGTPAAASRYSSLPEPTSSFGAVTTGDWLYVYGGHVVMTHRYSTASVSGRFHRLRLDGASRWESLPGGTALQGMNLAEYRGAIYRVGGMHPTNPPQTAPVLESVAEVARFDPARREWTALPSLPQPRSSHDVGVIGSTLYVVGGWDLQDEPAKSPWAETMLSLDLSVPGATWRSRPQPFKRRALITAVHGERLYVIGGMNERNGIERAVSIFDPVAGTWSSGPDLPGGDGNGFAPAAASVDGRLVVSLADGTVIALNARANTWEQIGTSTRRVAHRLVGHGGRALILGGAARDENLDVVESLDVR